MTTPPAPGRARPPAPEGDDWLGLLEGPLPVGDAADWVVLPRCGAVVLFSGTVRDHAGERRGVTHLDYEAYDEQIAPRLAELAADLRRRWPEVGRVVLLHRVGTLSVGESSVLVVVSAPHRAEAFAAARHGIDTLKATLPVWKREHWPGGSEWGLDATDVRPVGGDAADGPPRPATTGARHG